MEKINDFEIVADKLKKAGKTFDEKTLKLIYNFIEEFDDLFGKFVNRDELIERIINNLDKVEYDIDFTELGEKPTILRKF